jgi:nucleotide-binding universal stress UspA family protein
MKVLLGNDGSAWAEQAMELGKQIALATASMVDILAVGEQVERVEAASRAAQEVAKNLQAAGVSVTVHQRIGRLADEVTRQAHSAPYDLVVIGSRGRRGMKRLLFGSVAVHVVEHTPASVLVVKGQRPGLRRFLICTAAGPASESTVRFAGQLAQAIGASVTLLHVMSQLPLVEDVNSADLEAQMEELIRRGSREGVHLNRMLDLLTAEGTKARAVVRHGLVLDEVVAEAREGRFDLLVIGAHITPGIRSALVDNLSGQILLAVKCPVLVVHQTQAEL